MHGISSDDELEVHHPAHEYVLSLEAHPDQNGFEVSNGATKVLTTLPLSVRGERFTEMELRIDSAATCNIMPQSIYRKFGKDCDLRKRETSLISYCGLRTRARDKVSVLYNYSECFKTTDLETVD